MKIIQLSDIHLFADPGKDLLGVKTHESFHAVVIELKKIKDFDMILLTGDLSQDYSKKSYEEVIDTLSIFDKPIYCIPGNHDDEKIMSSIFPRKNLSLDRHIILDKWQLILLDSHQHKLVPGRLADAELTFLAEKLKQYPNHKAIIAFHHHPVQVNCKWLDKIGVKNADDFWETIKPFSNVSTILFGHIHQEHFQIKNNIPCYSVPSTCIQFATNQDHFGLENIPPGFRWIELKDGKLNTGVIRLDKYVGDFDGEAKGY